MSNSPVACKEIFDENSQPSQDEITDYAQHIGIDPASEGHLLPLAKDGLMQALPSPWKAYLDEKLKTHYYYNPETGITQWEHPLDKVYRKLVVRARTASERDNSMHTDTCASVQELLTFEENSKQTEKTEIKPEEFPTDSDESQSDLKQKPVVPLKKPTLSAQRPTTFLSLNKPLGGHNSLKGISDRKLSDIRNSTLRSSFDSPLPNRKEGIKMKESPFSQSDRINLFDRTGMFKQKSEFIDLSIKIGNEADGVATSKVQMMSDRGISLSGKGSMFLKNRSSSAVASPDTEKSLPFDISTKSEPPKGILREKTFELIERREEKRQEMKLVEDDRKSVRFNLEHKDSETVQEFSPSSNSSSDQHEKQSSIVPNTAPSPRPLDIAALKITNENLTDLPPRPTRNVKLLPIVKNEDRKKEPIKELPLKPKLWSKLESQESEDKADSQVSSERSESKLESNLAPQGKRLLRPPAGDFIKPNLFQKQFDKIADIIKPMSLDTDSDSEVKPRPRSPMIPQKNKISINLMESIESETSIDSPDKEFANFDLNEISEPIQLKDSEKNKIKQTDSNILSPLLNSPTIDINEKKKARISEMDKKLEEDLKKIEVELEEKKKEEEMRLREEMETHLRKMKEHICKEQLVETAKLKDRLKKQHEENKAEIEMAITNSQEQHKLSLQHVMDNIVLKLEAEREEAVRKEQERQREEIDKLLGEMEREHQDHIRKLKEEKSQELDHIKTKLEIENSRMIRDIRESLATALETEKARILTENRSALDKLKQDHDAMCDDIRKDYRSEVELLRSQHGCHLAELRARLSSEREVERRRRGDVCERDKSTQLEDKYRCLKEKYARLKSDVKMSIERRNKRREQSMTTGSETEKSNSHNKAPQSLEKSKDINEQSIVTSTKSEPTNIQSTNPIIQFHTEEKKDTVTDVKSPSSKIHLSVTQKNGNLSESSDQSKSLNIRDKSPISKLRESEKHKNSTDNEVSIGCNDTSLSHSESNTVSKGKNKFVAFSSDVDKSKKDKKKLQPHAYADKAATDYHDSSDTANSDKKAKESTHGRSRKKSFTRLKSASTSRLNYSPKRGDGSCSPVENLRQQLRKLEELEDQFPDLNLNVDSTGYRLRYPFADLGLDGRGVPELEFVAHRTLVEREGIRRARASLRRRRVALRDRRRRLSTAEQTERAWQEERDLTDLEVSLHRTRALLGEKVIRLRHIEKTLRKMAAGSSDNTSPEKAGKPPESRREDDKKDATLSDISSQSSGFSSTEGQSDNNIREVIRREARSDGMYENSSEIINSLDILNTEICDIWQVLNIQQRQNIAKVIPPGQILYNDLNFPILGIGSQRLGLGTGIPVPGVSSVPIANPLTSEALLTGPTAQMVPGTHNIPTLADRLHAYRQLTNQRNPGLATVVTTSGATLPGGVATNLVERTKDLRDWLRQQASL